MSEDMTAARADLLAIYLAALEAVNGQRCVALALARTEFTGPLYVVAVGKAAAAMYAGAQQALAGQIAEALVITKVGHADGLCPNNRLRLLEAGHPWPTQASLAAGEALLALMAAAPAEAQFLFLISGGASSLVEVLPPGVALVDLHRLNHWLLGSGLDIYAMNHVRKALSCIKGGRLAQRLAGRKAVTLLISDVPGDDPATIGSGLLMAESERGAVADLELPAWVVALMARGPALPLPGDVCFDSVEVALVASLAEAKRAAAAKGRALGYAVFEEEAVLRGDALDVACRLSREMTGGPAGLHIWGGETTVKLPEQPGRGGRNQALALRAAMALAGVENVLLLAAGTDGSDGPTRDAGALVDGGTLGRGEAQGWCAAERLAAADSGTFLAASGDLIRTGPMGTNVMDLVLGLKWPQG